MRQVCEGNMTKVDMLTQSINQYRDLFLMAKREFTEVVSVSMSKVTLVLNPVCSRVPRLSADPSPKRFLIGIHSRKIAMAGTMTAVVATAVTMALTTMTTILVVVTVHAVVHGVVEGVLQGPVAVAGEVDRRDRLGPPAGKMVTAVSAELDIRF